MLRVWLLSLGPGALLDKAMKVTSWKWHGRGKQQHSECM